MLPECRFVNSPGCRCPGLRPSDTRCSALRNARIRRWSPSRGAPVSVPGPRGYGPAMPRVVPFLTMILVVAVACSPDEAGGDAESGELPTWLSEVFPEPGAVVVAPDGVEVHHALTDPSHDVRLIIDGVDVTTYASFDAARMRYESGAGPIVIEPGEHIAEVQLVVLPVEGTDPEIPDSYSWEFRAD